MSSAAGAEVVRHQKGTPLDEDARSLSVLTYNVLAPLFVRPLDKRTGGVQPWAAFEWAEPAREVLDWDARRPRLLAELRAARADVLCLQEVQFERAGAGGHRFVLPPWLRQLAEEEGYSARLPSEEPLQQMAERNLRVLDAEVAIGCVVMYRHDRLEEVDEPSASRFANTLVGVCLRGRALGGLGSLGPTAVFSVHLDATSEEKRVEQMRKCLAQARQMGTREVVVAGDFNTECLPGSCVGAMDADCGEPTEEDVARECASALRIGDGDPAEGADAPEGEGEGDHGRPTEKQLKDFAALRDRAVSLCREHRVTFSHVATGPTRAAYDHGKTCGPCVSWRLDHIYYTARTLRLRSSWRALDGDPASAAKGLPNGSCPSDHLPVAAVFVPSPAPRLGEEDRRSLLDRLEALEASHSAACAALTQELDGLAAKAEAASPAVAATPAEGSKKKTKGTLSPEAVARVQERRRRLREQKQQHGLERAAFWAALGELEVDALEAERVAEAPWVETGARGLAEDGAQKRQAKSAR